jgi:hypothetical protein
MLRQGARVVRDSRRPRLAWSDKERQGGGLGPKQHSTDGTLADKAGLSGLEALDEALDYHCRPQDQHQP